MIENSLTEARQLIVQIAHGCEKCNPKNKNKKKDVPKPSSPDNSLQRDSFPAHHPPAAPNEDSFKDRGRTRLPDAHQPQTLSILKSFVNFLGQLIGHQISNIKFVT